MITDSHKFGMVYKWFKTWKHDNQDNKKQTNKKDRDGRVTNQVETIEKET